MLGWLKMDLGLFTMGLIVFVFPDGAGGAQLLPHHNNKHTNETTRFRRGLGFVGGLGLEWGVGFGTLSDWLRAD